jgi:hypothetical protein
MGVLKRTAKQILPTRVSRAIKELLRSGDTGPESHSGSVIPPTYDQDGLTTVHNCDFITDERFARAYAAGEALGSWFGGKVQWRVHVLFWAAERALAIGGDFVECGVHLGGFSRAVVEYVDFGRLSDRTFYLLDSFEGVSRAQVSQEEKDRGILEYEYANDHESVVATFAPFDNVKVIKGMIPDSLNAVDTDKVGFLSIDLNSAAPEIAAAEFFWDKLLPGATIVLDDYGWAKHVVQKHAFDKFAQRHNVPILSLPTGQGVIVKP